MSSKGERIKTELFSPKREPVISHCGLCLCRRAHWLRRWLCVWYVTLNLKNAQMSKWGRGPAVSERDALWFYRLPHATRWRPRLRWGRCGPLRLPAGRYGVWKTLRSSCMWMDLHHWSSVSITIPSFCLKEDTTAISFCFFLCFFL